LGTGRGLSGTVLRAGRGGRRREGGGLPRRSGRNVGVRVPAAPAAALARARLAAAAAVLVAAVLLRLYGIPPFPTWFYVVAWYPTLVILDQTIVLLGRESLLARPAARTAMLESSALLRFLSQ